jgi:hypothetical protein
MQFSLRQHEKDARRSSDFYLALLLTTVFALAVIVFDRKAVAETTSPAEKDAVHGVPLPPDLPLPASSSSRATWLRKAIVLQPYGHSEFAALANAGDRPRRLNDEFGFNAIIVQPTDSHNSIARPQDRLTEQQFLAGVAAYRAAGYRVMLYTSVMALGLAPEFQSGEVGRKHPDWIQRDPKGNPVLVWNVPWLCPSTGARDAALERCIRLARDYKPDGIMLDNNEFFFAKGGWTCHCDACRKAFREYVGRRFGPELTEKLFGVAPEKLQIPTEEGPLFALWVHWRNRVWAEINESFRARLREVNPKIVLFANTQYLYDTGVLGTDLQYAREDVVISESCNLNARQMSAKMVLGYAVADGRVLWNYIGTFAKADDYTGLLPAATIGPMIAGTLAHGARPWIVDGFDEGPTNAAARQEMARLLGWQARHPELFPANQWADVCTLVSLDSRNVLHQPLIPPHVSALQSAGTPVIALRDDELTAEKLAPFSVLTIETAACLGQKAANAIAIWVRNGGILLAARDTGTFDELGRRLSKSTLWAALGLDATPQADVVIGMGLVTAPAASEFAKTAVDRTRGGSFLSSADSNIEVVSYQTAHSLLLHLIRHKPANRPVHLNLPDAFLYPSKAVAQKFIPGSNDVKTLPLSVGPEFASLELRDVPLYCVLKIDLP